MTKSIILDLFCGVGGAAMGYHQAGFDVVGVDIAPQKRYPFEFHQADALEYCAEHGREFDVIHASPPCQRYSLACKAAHTAHLFPDLLPSTRDCLIENGKPYVIENVYGAPMNPTFILCGSMFGLPIVRHRLFEIHPDIFNLVAPCNHVEAPIGVYGKGGATTWYRNKTGHSASVQDWRNAMDIQWMTLAELAEAIPPAYTRWIGVQLMDRLRK